MMNPRLFPVPREISFSGGTLAMPPKLSYFVEEAGFEKAVSLLTREQDLSSASPGDAFIKFEKSSSPFQSIESYRLKIDDKGIGVESETAAGIFRATRTLKQLLQTNPSSIPCMEIEDQPAFERRGFMLDISRCKVPTMETIHELVDLLADLKYNELQLYIEHTFAFENHEEVWKEASPLNAEEVRAIDEYCRERFIELVPNLNSFGHFERWLRHEPYERLAECPDGFRRENPYIVRDHGTTLKPNQKSLDFIDSLYEEFLPNFSSGRFNVGMDEPWELGQGWSKTLIEEKGKQSVYLEHLDGIRKLVEKHGREMLFWADVLLEDPGNAPHVPKSASPVIWGYEAEHPFDKQAETISTCGLSFYLAPGTGSWRSFTGRLPNALANLRNAVDSGMAHGATGILVTSWGDCGNHQPWPTLYPGMIHGAGIAWNEKSDPEDKLAETIDQFLFPDVAETPARELVELGKLDLSLGSKIANTSLPWLLLFSSQPEKLEEKLKKDHPLEKLQRAQEILSSSRPRLAELSKREGNAGLVAREMLSGIDLSARALARGQKILGGSRSENLTSSQEILSDYRRNWLARARPGGLQESIGLLGEGLEQTH